MKTQYVIAIKQIRDYYGNPTEKWLFAQYDDHCGSYSSGYPIFSDEHHAITFNSVKEAQEWWNRNSKDIRLDKYDLSTLSVYERTYKKTEWLVKPHMSSKALLRSLKEKYSFEKAYSILQIATEDREFEDDNVRIVMNRTLNGDIYDLEWK